MKKTNKPTITYTPPSEGFFTITKVKYKGKDCTYRLYNNLTDSMNQERLAEFYEVEKKKGNPYPTNSILTFSILEAAAKSENNALKNSINDKLGKNWINTLSRIIYTSSGNDKIIHNYNTSDVYSLKGKIFGSDDWIKNLKDKDPLELILGTKDIKKINEISNFIFDVPMHLWRLNSKPSEKKERLVRFIAGSDGLGLGCNWDPLLEDPAFRVLRIK